MGLSIMEIQDINELSDKDLTKILKAHRDYVAAVAPEAVEDCLFWNLDYFDEALVSKLGFDDLIGDNYKE